MYRQFRYRPKLTHKNCNILHAHCKIRLNLLIWFKRFFKVFCIPSFYLCNLRTFVQEA